MPAQFYLSFLLLKKRDSFLLTEREAELNSVAHAGRKEKRKLHGSGNGKKIWGFVVNEALE